MVPKKNGKLRVCIDFHKLNSATVKDPFPLPFLEAILDVLVWKSAYSFLDGYSGRVQPSTTSGISSGINHVRHLMGSIPMSSATFPAV